MSTSNSKSGMKRADKIHAAALVMMIASAVGLYFTVKQWMLVPTLLLLAVFVGANLLELTNK